jgi:hypothetical protein
MFSLWKTIQHISLSVSFVLPFSDLGCFRVKRWAQSRCCRRSESVNVLLSELLENHQPLLITQRWELTAVVANTMASHLSFVIPQCWVHYICRRRHVLGVAKTFWRKACPLRIYRWATSDRNATKHPAILTRLQRTVTFQGVSCVNVFMLFAIRK